MRGGSGVARLLLAVLITAAAAVLGWKATGGGVFVIESPSMGTTAPVGSLVWTRPAGHHVAAGDVITFRAPGRQAGTYTHRVRSVDAGGGITTGGDISGRDPWRLSSGDVVGRVVSVWPGLGWVATTSRTWLVGASAVVLALRFVPRHLVLPVALVGGAIVLATVLGVHRPLARADQLAYETRGGMVRATYVGTGVLPVRVAPVGGGSETTLRPGEVGVVEAPVGASATGVTITPVVPVSLRILTVLACCAPALIETLRARRTTDAGAASRAVSSDAEDAGTRTALQPRPAAPPTAGTPSQAEPGMAQPGAGSADQVA